MVVDPEKEVVLVVEVPIKVVVVVARVVVVVVGGSAWGMNGSLLLNVDRASTSVGTLVVVEAPVLEIVSGSVRSD